MKNDSIALGYGLMDFTRKESRRSTAGIQALRGWSATSFSNFFTTSTVTNTRGHTAKINKPRCHLELRRSFFSYRDKLPQSVIDSGTINAFKNGLDTLRKNRMGSFTDYSWSAWPSDLISSEVTEEQVRPHLVSYNVKQ